MKTFKSDQILTWRGEVKYLSGNNLLFTKNNGRSTTLNILTQKKKGLGQGPFQEVIKSGKSIYKTKEKERVRPKLINISAQTFSSLYIYI